MLQDIAHHSMEKLDAVPGLVAEDSLLLQGGGSREPSHGDKNKGCGHQRAQKSFHPEISPFSAKIQISIPTGIQLFGAPTDPGKNGGMYPMLTKDSFYILH
jgi:hypothetical protein